MLRWDCKTSGCYHKKLCPKFDIFSDCFPGKINFGDVDGIVEINGSGLMMEWKTFPRELAFCQKIMYERLTRGGMITVFCVAGDAETMHIKNLMIYFNGECRGGWIPATVESVKQKIKGWVSWAKNRH